MAAAAAVLVAPVVAGLRQSLALVLVGLAALALTLAGVWWALTNKGLVRALAIALAVAAPLTVLMLYTKARLTWVVLVALWLLALAVAAGIAAEHGIPLLGISAGTRNHFAVDLGPDREDPSRRLDALKDGVELQVDLGFIGDRLFVNNASFGAYASVVQSPAYRDDKARTTGDRSRHASSTRAMRALLLAERGRLSNGLPLAVLLSRRRTRLASKRSSVPAHLAVTARSSPNGGMCHEGSTAMLAPWPSKRRNRR